MMAQPRLPSNLNKEQAEMLSYSEKGLPSPTPASAWRHGGRGRRFYVRLVWTLLFCALLFFQMSGRGIRQQAMVEDKKVPLEIHIMSKCPDARDCLRDLILPTMQLASDKVDFKLSFIGKASNNDDMVVCMHGTDECLGNIIELCSAALYPDPKMYLGFTNCMSRDYQQIPEESFVTDCALEFGLDFGKLNDCISKDDGAYGIELLRESVTRSAEANVTKSCTVRLNEEIRCIRDGGQWSDCDKGSSVDSLVRDVKELYSQINP